MHHNRWKSDKEERSRFIWRTRNNSEDYGISLPVNAAGAVPPPQKRCASAGNFLKNFKATQNTKSKSKSCAVLSTLLEKQKDPESRLSWLPVEIILEIYNYVFKFWESHIETKGVFASVVSKVNFPPPNGINCNMMPIIMGDTLSIPKNMRQYVPLLAGWLLHMISKNHLSNFTSNVEFLK